LRKLFESFKGVVRVIKSADRWIMKKNGNVREGAGKNEHIYTEGGWRLYRSCRPTSTLGGVGLRKTQEKEAIR